MASAILGVSAAGWNGLMAAALAEVGGTERAASALGLGLTAIFAASAVAPSLFGAVADHTSLPAAWAVNAAIVLLGLAPMLWLRTHSSSPRACRGAPGAQRAVRERSRAKAEPWSVRAQVAELVDALVSGISGRKAVGVRVPSWAPYRRARHINNDAPGFFDIGRRRPSRPVKRSVRP